LTQDDLTGLPDFVVSAAKQAAADRNKPEGTYVITLSRSLVEPFLTYSDRQDLRQTAWYGMVVGYLWYVVIRVCSSCRTAWTKRGELEDARDNKPVVNKILKLRARQAQMHGYSNFADYATADTMAGSPQAVMELLEVRHMQT
jgi:peptidyl-dipeptidase Dcp